jgi:hypothetical protein
VKDSGLIIEDSGFKVYQSKARGGDVQLLSPKP